jgi:hypothetical protein
MARKPQHSFAKRQRELKKAKKSRDKRERKAARTDASDPLPESSDDQPVVDEQDATASE